jgi:hypothetical protein
MNDRQDTVDTFFEFTRLRKLGSEDYEKVLEELPMDRIIETLHESKPGLAMFITAEALVDALASFLDIPLWGLIKQAWTEGKLFEKYCDPENYDENELIMITLKDHEISSEHKPTIDVLLDGKTIGSIEFQLDLTLTLSGAGLQVRGGDIEEIRTGQIQGTANLACEGVPLFPPLQTEKMDLLAPSGSPGKLNRTREPEKDP